MACLGFRFAQRALFFLKEFEVELHLLLEVGVKLTAMEKHFQATSEFTEPIHRRVPLDGFDDASDRRENALELG